MMTAEPQIVLKPRRALPFFCGHPWVYDNAIARVSGDPQPGEEAGLVSHEGVLISHGLFNPHSKIRVRLYGAKEDERLDRDFWSRRLDEAFALRSKIWGPLEDQSVGQSTSSSARRLVFSEADGLSGLIVDRYAGWLVVQFTSLAMASRKAMLIELLMEKLRPQGIWLRTEKEIRQAEGMDLIDGPLWGETPTAPLFIEENGVRYGVDIVKGQKTGFYLDQRENRAALMRYTRDAKVLDMFCYTGGFGLSALVGGGAKEVWGIDSSASALALATENAKLNDQATKCRFEKSSAVEALEQFKKDRRRFDVIVLDPPKLARRREGIDRALRAYTRFHRAAVGLTTPGGIVVSCCCSGIVSREMFEETLSRAAAESHRRLQILESRGQSPDHPVSVQCMENNYLKCYICRVT